MALAVLGVAGLAPFACGGKVGEALPPTDPTAAQAMNEGAQKCTATKTTEPLVIDLSSSQRTALEVAMRQGWSLSPSTGSRS